MSKPFVYVGQSQAPGVYELCFVSDDSQVTYCATLNEFTMLGQNIIDAVEKRKSDEADRRARFPAVST